MENREKYKRQRRTLSIYRRHSHPKDRSKLRTRRYLHGPVLQHVSAGDQVFFRYTDQSTPSGLDIEVNQQVQISDNNEKHT